MAGILWAIFVILLILWLLGWLAFHVGTVIHVLLIIAVIVLIWNLIMSTRRRAL